MEATSAPLEPTALRSRRRLGDRAADIGLHGLTAIAAAGVVALVVAIAYKTFDGASPAISKFGVSFLWHTTWDPIHEVFGALDFIYGTAITSVLALMIAAPLSIAIGLYLSELAPRGVRGVVGSLVEMLAAVPSVVLGLWGIIVLLPFIHAHLEPWLHRYLGFIPLFGTSPAGGGNYFGAILILTIMVVPITSSISRELFLSVPRELEEGALALGLTRWEMARGVILPYTRAGVVAAVLLGLGRAVGEAIAVSQVIGNANIIAASLFSPGDTLGSRIAGQYVGATSRLAVGSLAYLAAILLVFALVANVVAQLIVSRFEFQRTGGS